MMFSLFLVGYTDISGAICEKLHLDQINDKRICLFISQPGNCLGCHQRKHTILKMMIINRVSNPCKQDLQQLEAIKEISKENWLLLKDTYRSVVVMNELLRGKTVGCSSFVWTDDNYYLVSLRHCCRRPRVPSWGFRPQILVPHGSSQTLQRHWPVLKVKWRVKKWKFQNSWL